MGFDLEGALERTGGDEEILKEIAELFLEDGPDLLMQIREAIDAKDAGALQKAAHTLKGSVANFGAEEAVETAFRLETMGREDQLSDVEAVYRSLEAAIHEVKNGLERL